MNSRKSAPTTLPRLLTVPEAAEALAVSARTVWRWIEAGELETYRLGSAGPDRTGRAQPVPREAAPPLTTPDNCSHCVPTTWISLVNTC